MLKGFEEITADLTPEEIKIIVPVVLAKLATHIGTKNAVKNQRIIEYCECRNIRMTESKVRKIIEYIRQRRLLPRLVASSVGYFVAETPQELKMWIDSMTSRKHSLEVSIKAALIDYEKMVNPKAKNPKK